MNSPRIAIVGAGPAGLTAATAACRLGLEVTVFEQASDFRRIGGGIAIQDNGQRVLEGQHGNLITLSLTPARIVRNWLLPVVTKVDWLSRRGILLASGYNPKEESYFRIPSGRV